MPASSTRCVADGCRHPSVHVIDIGLTSATDPQIMASALAEGRTVVSADTDFAEILAVGGYAQPSLILFRGEAVTAEDLAVSLLANLGQVTYALEAGAIVAIFDDRVRVRLLPVERND